MLRLSIGAISLSIMAGFYPYIKKVQESNYLDKLITKYKDKSFSYGENYDKKVCEFPLDLDNNGTNDVLLVGFDLDKKFWKKTKIESLGYFEYSPLNKNKLNPYARIFCTFEQGNLNKTHGGLIDKDKNGTLDWEVDEKFMNSLLKNIKINTRKNMIENIMKSLSEENKEKSI